MKGRSIFDVLEDLKVEIAADAKAKNLVDNVIKLSKAKNYSNEESLNILNAEFLLMPSQCRNPFQHKEFNLKSSALN